MPAMLSLGRSAVMQSAPRGRDKGRARALPHHAVPRSASEPEIRSDPSGDRSRLNAGCQRISASRPGEAVFGIARLARVAPISRFITDLGRVVITHSTYVDGLIPWLKRLAKQQGIQTITPAVISRVRGRCQTLQLRVSSPIRGGYKLMARKGSMAQEVFVVTELDAEQLRSAVQAHQP